MSDIDKFVKSTDDFAAKSRDTANEIIVAVNNRVKKEAGKGLSTNDYTTTEKQKLAGIEAASQKNTVTSVNSKTGAVVISIPDIANLTTELGKKVDKVAGKDLSTNDFTNNYKSILDQMGMVKFLGEYLTIAALKLAYPEGIASAWHKNEKGFYAFIDAKSKDAKMLIWDSTDFKWVESSTTLTASEVAALYESIGDVERFTTILLNKLNGIESGAEKNAVITVNGKSAVANRNIHLTVGGKNLLNGTSSEDRTTSKNFDYTITQALPKGNYVYTVWMRSSEVSSAKVYINDDTGGNKVFWEGVHATITTEYQRFEFPINLEKTDEVSSFNIRVRVYAASGVNLTGKLAKLEAGELSTAWCPSELEKRGNWAEQNPLKRGYIINKPISLSQFIDDLSQGIKNWVSSNFVPLLGAVTKKGTMTFEDSPIVPLSPTLAPHAASKKYVDDNDTAINNAFTGYDPLKTFTDGLNTLE